MRRRVFGIAVCGAALVVAVVCRPTPLSATDALPGFTGKTVASGAFADFQVFNQVTRKALPPGFDGSVWLSMQKTQGPSDVFIQSNTWTAVDAATGAVTASTGWQAHPGHSLMLITSGMVTEYEADCTPRIYGPGSPLGATLVDPGGDHVHLIRNEGLVAATGFAVQITPHGAARRNNAAAPDSCPAMY